MPFKRYLIRYIYQSEFGFLSRDPRIPVDVKDTFCSLFYCSWISRDVHISFDLFFRYSFETISTKYTASFLVKLLNGVRPNYNIECATATGESMHYFTAAPTNLIESEGARSDAGLLVSILRMHCANAAWIVFADSLETDQNIVYKRSI